MAQKTSLAHQEVGPETVGKSDGTIIDLPTAPHLYAPVPEQKDYFVECDGVRFAGCHVLADLWGAQGLNDQALIEDALRAAVEACGATLLHIHLHQFTDSGGVSGVAVLAESHISVHTWPERNFAAFDVFMCGSCDPEKALPVLRSYFQPADMQVDVQRRGILA